MHCNIKESRCEKLHVNSNQNQKAAKQRHAKKNKESQNKSSAKRANCSKEQEGNKGTFTNVQEEPKDTLAMQGVEKQPGPKIASSKVVSKTASNEKMKNEAYHGHGVGCKEELFLGTSQDLTFREPTENTTSPLKNKSEKAPISHPAAGEGYHNDDYENQSEDDDNFERQNFTHAKNSKDFSEEDNEGAALLIMQNCTSAEQHKREIAGKKANMAIYQETALTDDNIRQFQNFVRNHGWESHLTKASAESNKPSAGVANLVKCPGIALPLKPITDDYKELVESGRGIITMCTANNKMSMYICNGYGWTNGHSCKYAAAKTSSMINIFREELRMHPALPTALACDLNAEPKDIAAIMDLLKEGWTDLGEKAQWWGGLAEQPTCQATNSTHLTRRDFIFVNPTLLPHIRGFNIHWTDEYPVHAEVQVQIDTGKEKTWINKNIKPADLIVAFENYIKAAAEKVDTNNPSEALKQARRETIEKAHWHMDQLLIQNATALERNRKQGDTHQMWRCISRCIERGIGMAIGIQGEELRAYRGHGKTNIKNVPVKEELRENQEVTDPDKAMQSILEHATGCCKQAIRCIKQGRRIQQIISRVQKKVRIKQKDKAAYKIEWNQEREVEEYKQDFQTEWTDKHEQSMLRLNFETAQKLKKMLMKTAC